MKTENFIKNESICNIYLVEIDEWRKREYDWTVDYEIGEYVWVCGEHGYEGVLNDGEVILTSRSIEDLLKKIIDYKIIEKPQVCVTGMRTSISSAYKI